MQNIKDIFQLAGAVIIASGASGAVLFGLSSWLGKIWAERILRTDRLRYERCLADFRHQLNSEIEVLKAKNQRRVLVHKVQFETEFEAYKDIWTALSELSANTLALRPILDSINLGESESERKTRRFKEWHECMRFCCETIRRYEPFLPIVVLEKVDALTRSLNNEAIQYAKLPNNQAYWEQQKQNSEKIDKLIDEVCDVIRERIGLLEVDSSLF